MKNPNTMLLLTVIVGVLVLGVAYAAIQNTTLTVTGNVTATPDQGNFDVKFTGTPRASGDGVAEVKLTGSLMATMDVTGLKSVGDTINASFEITNNSPDIEARLTTTLTHINEEYFQVRASLEDNWVTSAQDGLNKTFLNITVKLIKIPITDTVTDSINVKVVATPYVS